MRNHAAVQRRIAKLLLSVTADAGFALAGAGALREHGIVDRPTEDIDVFTVMEHADEFEESVDSAIAHLRERGFSVEVLTSNPGFRRIQVASADGDVIDVDLGIDWRSASPVFLDVGPVLAPTDAMGSKITALYSRGYPRDFLDVDAIRRAGSFTDEELLQIAENTDPGFDRATFALQLRQVRVLSSETVAAYRVSAADLALIQERLTQWADDIETPPEPNSQSSTFHQIIDDMHHLAQQPERFKDSSSAAPRAEPGPPVVDSSRELE
ncbi:nucleotidyl transferase AbiEii/AbiGii toxin family protein [Corynebacterium timonense]|uniref:Nucleotidyl transferase AbiEii toxin, Type IV TA system n=1 Tax=Corynebacterium timonense TaxID=441500 RepID=A0A1H1LZF9_9CORY|nr:nucleotidyl transferase AbiEii/AbiGii toxin family protein [Corynebacterium timonense]SDR79455.1 Nucleotidyl transferase AbiEii toxin, Type IV TA system [Corynebacterium timonense]